MKEKLVNTIETEKEILSAMPLKTKKNKSDYLNALKKLYKKFSLEENYYKNEIILRSNKIKKIKDNKEIETINNQIKSVEDNFYLINKYLTPYEKIGLDRVVFGLNHFYKDNLVRVNKLIVKAIKLFSEVGINLTPAYFDYSQYTYEYMSVFFDEMDDDIKSDKIREVFNKIYWECPLLITHLDLNIRYLYLENIDKFTKYFDEKKKEYLTKGNKKEEDIIANYQELIKKRDNLVNRDAKLILDSFIFKKNNINDFDKTKINKLLDKLIIDKEYYDQNQSVVNENIISLEHTLEEYQNYLTFEFVINDIKNKFNDRNSFKNAYKNKLKEITKLENNLRKKNLKIYNEKNSKKPNKMLIEKELNAIEPIYSELNDKYKELEVFSFNEQIVKHINDYSTYYEMLSLASSNYNYLTSCIINNDSSLSDDEVKLKVYKLQTFVNSPYNNIINNVNLSDNKDIKTIVIDRYRLLDIELNEENMDSGLEDLQGMVHILGIYFNILESRITTDEIAFVINTSAINSNNS